MHMRSLFYKLDISNYKTVSNDKDMNNPFQVVLKSDEFESKPLT